MTVRYLFLASSFYTTSIYGAFRDLAQFGERKRKKIYGVFRYTQQIGIVKIQINLKRNKSTNLCLETGFLKKINYASTIYINGMAMYFTYCVHEGDLIEFQINFLKNDFKKMKHNFKLKIYGSQSYFLFSNFGNSVLNVNNHYHQ